MYPIKEKELIVTSPFGYRTLNGKKSFHKGIDLIGANKSIKSEIVAFEDGEVTRIINKGEKGGTACSVRIKHEGGYYTFYTHLKNESIVVKKGNKVKKGQKLGIIGNTGNTTGVHLHFQIDEGDGKNPINPADYVFSNKPLPMIRIPDKYYRRGDRGEAVGKIDDFLFELYGNKKVLGNIYGKYTEKYVKQFQKQAKKEGIYNDKADGVCGPLTLDAMRKDGFKY